ncbi:hypothetical protein [Pleionea litopenaei]|uniref:Acyl-CoA desaturase n=1 Tax=Pleionea litopenaei TaxID=3070815 RepID=A0AA51X7A6_9GAMM|nr:hypothetical protein [Pleionea sp. HL-JVS1]WMS88117.1 hypothetical protein Q9312_04190 [Pleionea sp. HL-JVS1]
MNKSKEPLRSVAQTEPTRKPKIIWLNVSVFVLTTTIALIGVPLYGYLVGFDLWHWVFMIIGIGYCGMSITAGYHRLWSHKAYKANAVIRFFYAIGGLLQYKIAHCIGRLITVYTTVMLMTMIRTLILPNAVFGILI